MTIARAAIPMETGQSIWLIRKRPKPMAKPTSISTTLAAGMPPRVTPLIRRRRARIRARGGLAGSGAFGWAGCFVVTDIRLVSPPRR